MRTHGTDTLGILDPATGELTDLDLGDHTTVTLGAAIGGQAYVVTAGARTPSGGRVLDLAGGDLRDVRLSVDDLPRPRTCPRPGR